MLIPNLSVLLAERRLTLSKVSEDTRISRTTLTALTAGHAKGVQFDTLNTLCQYLNVAPGDLFLYRPFDLTAASTGLPGHSAVTFTLRRAGRPEETHALACNAEYLFSDAHTLDALRVRLTSPKDDPRATDFLTLLQSLPTPALTALEFDILRAFDAHIDPSLAPRDYTPDLLWPWQ